MQAALVVEPEPEGVPAAFREDLERPRVRMISPHHAAFEVDAGRIRRIEAGSDDAARGGAALAAVEPAVRSPHEAVGDGMRVLEPEAREAHLGRSVRHVVAVAVGVEEQIGRVHHPHAAAADDHGVGHVEPVEEYLVPVVHAVAVGVLVDRDDVGAAVVAGRGRRHLVVVGAIIFVAAEHLQAGGVGVLTILGDPEAAASVEAEVGRLRHQRLAQQEVGREVGGGPHLGGGFHGRELGSVDLLGASEHAAGFLEPIERRRRRSLRERATGCVTLARAGLPRSGQHGFQEVIHDERRVAQEAARPGARRLVDPDGDLVPSTLHQGADRDLVAVDGIGSAAERGREGAAGADLLAVHPDLMRAGEVADVHTDRFLEQVPLVLGEV